MSVLVSRVIVDRNSCGASAALLWMSDSKPVVVFEPGTASSTTATISAVSKIRRIRSAGRLMRRGSGGSITSTSCGCRDRMRRIDGTGPASGTPLWTRRVAEGSTCGGGGGSGVFGSDEADSFSWEPFRADWSSVGMAASPTGAPFAPAASSSRLTAAPPSRPDRARCAAGRVGDGSVGVLLPGRAATLAPIVAHPVAGPQAGVPSGGSRYDASILADSSILRILPGADYGGRSGQP